MNWLHYLLEANLYLCIFYAVYCLFLNKETHYTLNRVYLLLSCVISFVLPVVQIGWLKVTESPTTTFIIPRNGKQAIDHKLASQPASSLQELLLYAYILGAIVLTTVLLVRLYQLAKLTKATKTLVHDKYKLISIEGSNTAFSFFNYLFIGTKTQANNIIIRHELVHIRQKHSADIVFLELIKILNWFNPLIYLLQISLKTIHEYIADEQTAAQESDALSYSSFLVSNAYGLNGSSLAHSFFNYNLLKKRIIMLNQKRSGKLARLKYLVAVPISAGLLCASTLVFSKSYGFIDLMPKQQIVTPSANAQTSSADTIKADPIRIKKEDRTSKGYQYEETGYLVNNKTDYRVIITEKNGEQKEYYKSKATPEELATLKSKYGYTFPKMMIYPKLPPPPPAPPAPGKKTKGIDAKVPPPPPNPEKVKKAPKVVKVQEAIPVGEPIAPAQPSASAKLPPPPPPADPMDPLYKYIAKHVRYPAAARNNRITGQVTVGFKLSNGKINGVKVLKSADPQIDKEVARVVSDFDGKLAGLNQGDYTVTVALELATSNDKFISNNIDKEKSQVVVVGYVD
ncbi:M56 family metallopeptidase [Mucilaginibacter rubeus]|uniref:TonB family protein n=1 Tax=Mucilaginibacter rubeus TaxID=2027860 RepID=A0A5C1HUV0_9SPHI|nr:M56 family metallopeptidase [Mucilaginibacter rubeus]QEM09455.1 TonB family protein [Mucilaginibacter rubeus]